MVTYNSESTLWVLDRHNLKLFQGPIVCLLTWVLFYLCRCKLALLSSDNEHFIIQHLFLFSFATRKPRIIYNIQLQQMFVVSENLSLKRIFLGIEHLAKPHYFAEKTWGSKKVMQFAQGTHKQLIANFFRNWHLPTLLSLYSLFFYLKTAFSKSVSIFIFADRRIHSRGWRDDPRRAERKTGRDNGI